MQKFVSKYALAAHLGILTVAPLFLFPFFDPHAIGITWLWMSLVAAIWIVMEPSRIGLEFPHDARRRVIRTIVRDPFFYFLLAAVVWAAIRALNGGVGMWYDAEIRQWAFKRATVAYLPGSVNDIGFLPFCASVAMLVAATGIRHALGRAARFAYCGTAAAIAGLAGLVFAVQYLSGNQAVLLMANCDSLSPFYVGSAFGVALFLGIAGLFGAAEQRWLKAELPFAAGVTGCMAGMLVFSTLLSALVFIALAFLLIVAGFFFNRKVFEGASSLRCGVFLIAMAVLCGMLVTSADPGSGLDERFSRAREMRIFPAEYFKTGKLLSGYAAKTFKGNLWLGAGLGSFPVKMRFLASASDYRIVTPGQFGAFNGYLQSLSERGVVGTAVFVVALGFLFWSYVSRLVSSFGKFELRAIHLVFPLVAIAAIVMTFFECSWLRSDVQAVAIGALAVSAGAIPANRRRRDSGKEAQNGG